MRSRSPRALITPAADASWPAEVHMLGDLPAACSSADFSSKVRIRSIVSSACVTDRSTTGSTVVTCFSFRSECTAGRNTRLLRDSYRMRNVHVGSEEDHLACCVRCHPEPRRRSRDPLQLARVAQVGGGWLDFARHDTRHFSTSSALSARHLACCVRVIQSRVDGEGPVISHDARTSYGSFGVSAPQDDTAALAFHQFHPSIHLQRNPSPRRRHVTWRAMSVSS